MLAQLGMQARFTRLQTGIHGAKTLRSRCGVPRFFAPEELLWYFAVKKKRKTKSWHFLRVALSPPRWKATSLDTLGPDAQTGKQSIIVVRQLGERIGIRGLGLGRSCCTRPPSRKSCLLFVHIYNTGAVRGTSRAQGWTGARPLNEQGAGASGL